MLHLEINNFQEIFELSILDATSTQRFPPLPPQTRLEEQETIESKIIRRNAFFIIKIKGLTSKSLTSYI